MPRTRLSPEERTERRREAALKGARDRRIRAEVAKCQEESLGRITDLAVNGPDGRMLIRQAQAIGREADLWYHAAPEPMADQADRLDRRASPRGGGVPQVVHPARWHPAAGTAPAEEEEMTSPPPARPVVPAGAEGMRRLTRRYPMQITVTDSPELARPSGRSLQQLLGGLTAIARELEAPTPADDRDPTRARIGRHRSTRKSMPRPGRRTGRTGATPGSRRPTGRRTTRTRRRTGGSSWAGAASRYPTPRG